MNIQNKFPALIEAETNSVKKCKNPPIPDIKLPPGIGSASDLSTGSVSSIQQTFTSGYSSPTSKFQGHSKECKDEVSIELISTYVLWYMD